MKIEYTTAKHVNGKEWHSVIPETHVDRIIITRVFMETLRNTEELDDYYLGFDADGIDSDGSLLIRIAEKESESFRSYGGLMTLFVHNSDSLVRIDFEPGAEEILPHEMAKGIFRELAATTGEELADTPERWQQCMEMIEHEYPEDNE